MPRLTEFYGIIIYLYYFDHNPPHFHARYGGEEVVISMVDLTILFGKIPNRALSMVIEWASKHRLELMKNWDRAQKGEKIKSIEPLL